MKIFNQGRTGSPTYNYVNNRAKTQYSWAPSSRPNPRTDLGARSSRAIGNWWNNNFDEEESEEESVGWDDQPSHTRAHRPTGQSVSNYYNNWRL